MLCEYDALPDIGHACGHNLIAECGVAAAIGIKSAMEAAGGHMGQVCALPDVLYQIKCHGSCRGSYGTGQCCKFLSPGRPRLPLPDLGHACGHNLIAECGVAAAIGIKSAMEAAGGHMVHVCALPDKVLWKQQGVIWDRYMLC